MTRPTILGNIETMYCLELVLERKPGNETSTP